MNTGGQGGIRTHGTLASTTVFKTVALNHSATYPDRRKPNGWGEKFQVGSKGRWLADRVGSKGPSVGGLAVEEIADFAVHDGDVGDQPVTEELNEILIDILAVHDRFLEARYGDLEVEMFKLVGK